MLTSQTSKNREDKQISTNPFFYKKHDFIIFEQLLDCEIESRAVSPHPGGQDLRRHSIKSLQFPNDLPSWQASMLIDRTANNDHTLLLQGECYEYW